MRSVSVRSRSTSREEMSSAHTHRKSEWTVLLTLWTQVCSRVYTQPPISLPLFRSSLLYLFSIRFSSRVTINFWRFLTSQHISIHQWLIAFNWSRSVSLHKTQLSSSTHLLTFISSSSSSSSCPLRWPRWPTINRIHYNNHIHLILICKGGEKSWFHSLHSVLFTCAVEKKEKR